MDIHTDSAGLRGAERSSESETVAIVCNGSKELGELVRVLVVAGYSVCRYGGEEALRSIQPDDTDIILLDDCQSQATSFELCRQFKTSFSHRNIPVVFVGAEVKTEHKLRGFQCGGVDYITFPLQEDEVIARIRSHIGVFSARRELLSVQEELRLSKNSLKMAQEIAKLGHWEWEMDSDTIRWSDEAYRILGYTPHECMPSHEVLLRRVHPDEREKVTAHFAQIQESGNFDLEFRIILPGGRGRMLHGRGQVACLLNCRYPHIIEPAKGGGERHEHSTFIGVIQDVTERKEIEQRLEIEANTDVLTGCASRRYFLELAQQGLELQRQQQGTLSLLMLDLDNFKRINDSYGHQAGDLTLQTLAETCRQQLRADDVIGRLGGEEFAVVLPGTPHNVALDIAERLRGAIEDAMVPFGDGLQFTASIGITSLEDSDKDVDALLYRADRALYAAKQKGRNKVCFDTD